MTEAMKGHLAMLCFSALVAGSFALGSMAANHVEPVVLNAVRFMAASVILGVAATPPPASKMIRRFQVSLIRCLVPSPTLHQLPTSSW